MDWHPTTCPDNVFELATFLAVCAHLRSASAGQLMVPITNKKTIGDKGFSHCGPVAWNNLPLHLRSDDCTPSLDCFKKHLERPCSN